MTSSHRRAYVDWARGIAVLLMIEAHTVDAWTLLSPAVRRTIPFRDATVLGGFAAPLFLWLAGLAVVLAATRTAGANRQPAGGGRHDLPPRARDFHPRFLFRLQGFIITPGSHPVTLFRVDILNIMGPAIVGAGLVWGLARSTTAARDRATRRSRRRSRWRRRSCGPRPRIAVAGRSGCSGTSAPAGEFTIFTLFPWAGFVFAGSAVGRADRGGARERARSGGCTPRSACPASALVAAGLLRRRPAVDLRVLVVLDELADLVRDPARHPDDGADRDLWMRGGRSRP